MPDSSVALLVELDTALDDFKFELGDDYARWPFRVQYRESDFNFVARLMEQEGMHGYFLHESGRHQLVVADGAHVHEAAPGYERVPFLEPEQASSRQSDGIRRWSHGAEIQPGRCVLRDFDFEKPRADLQVSADALYQSANCQVDEIEGFDFPGVYKERSDGERIARVRVENFNEIRFEDLKGSEELRIHAERDQTLHTEHDRVEFVGNDSHLGVGHDQFESIAGERHLSVKQDMSEHIGGDSQVQISGDQLLGIDQSQFVEVLKDWQLQVGGKLAASADQEIHLRSGVKIVIEARVQLSLVAGSSFVDIGPAGVTISGALVKINSGGGTGSGSAVKTKKPKLGKKPKQPKAAKPPPV